MAADPAGDRLCGLLGQLALEIRRQDAKHGPFQGSPLGRSRLALACLEDETREALEAWRGDRRAATWADTRAEVMQVAAVALRALRDALTDTPPPDAAGASNLV